MKYLIWKSLLPSKCAKLTWYDHNDPNYHLQEKVWDVPSRQINDQNVGDLLLGLIKLGPDHDDQADEAADAHKRGAETYRALSPINEAEMISTSVI